MASRSLSQSIAAVLSGRTVVRILGIAYTPILVRLLSKEEYGTFAVFLAVFTTTAMLSKGGLFSSVRKHVAEYSPDDSEQSQLVAGGLLLSVAYAVFVALLALGVAATDSYREQAPILVLLAISVLARNPYDIFRSAFYGRRREDLSERLNVARKVLYVVLALVLAAYGYGAIGVLVGYTVAYALILPVAAWMVFRSFDVGQFLSVKTLRSHGRQLVQFGGVQMTGALAALLLYRTDILLIEHFMAPTDAATYQAALVPAELVWFVPSAIQAALLQDMSSSWSKGKISQINESLHSSLKYAILALTLLGIGLFGLADEFVRMYFGLEYEGAALPLKILLFGTFFFGVNRVYVSVLQATGRVNYDTLNMIVALGVNVILNVILIPHYGILGAAIGTSVSYASVFVGSLVILRFTSIVPISRADLPRLFLTIMLFAGIYLPVTNLGSLGDLPSLLVFSAFGGSLFVVISIATGTVRREAIQNVLSTSSVE